MEVGKDELTESAFVALWQRLWTDARMLKHVTVAARPGYYS